jgi:ferredoxin/flavodoxin---NADP+ reductase
MQNNYLNGKVDIHRSNNNSSIFRVYPEFPIRVFQPGQYGSLGLLHDSKDKLIKRAYSISSSIIDLTEKILIIQRDLKFLEFYINHIPISQNKRAQITPKLFTLNNGDKIYCGEKIVGHYVINNPKKWKNILLISTHTGESPNNSIVNQLLLNGLNTNICNINIGKTDWKSLYTKEHILLQKLYSNYKFIQYTDNSDKYLDISDFISSILMDKSKAVKNIGFNPETTTTLIMLCGDPIMIGAPIKKGGFNILTPNYGLINILVEESFELTTRFKEGNIIYESYW